MEAKPVKRREKVSQAAGANPLALRCQRQDQVTGQARMTLRWAELLDRGRCPSLQPVFLDEAHDQATGRWPSHLSVGDPLVSRFQYVSSDMTGKLL